MMTTPNLFAKLPIELLHEICLDLDIASLKSLKLASTDLKTHAAANTILFETLTLRLGTLEWSRVGAESRLPYINYLTTANGHDKLDSNAIAPLSECMDLGFFPFVKTLVIDTRFPFVVTSEKCFERHQAIEGFDSYILEYEDNVAPYEELITQSEQAALLKILGKVLAFSKNLHVVRWRGSDSIPLDIHREMCLILCSPLQERRFELDISFTIRTDKMDKTYYQYLTAISCAQHLSLMICKTDIDSCRESILTPEDLHELATLVERTQSLKTFEFFNENLVFSAYIDIDPLLKVMDGGEIGEALAKFETLEAIAGNINIGISNRFDLTKTRKLKRIGSTYKYGGCYFFHGNSPGLYDSLHAAGIILDTFSVGTYCGAKAYLLKHEPVLTDLELGFIREPPDTNDGLEIWGEIVPRFAKTLKHLKVWSWFTYEHAPELIWLPGGTAQTALRECRRLEDLAICSVFADECFTTEMLEDVLTFCPKLGRIEIKISMEDSEMNLESTFDKIAGWESDNTSFAGKSILLTYKDREGMNCLPKKLAEGYIPPLWYDYLLQSYRLEEHQDPDSDRTTFRLERQNDVFLLDDNLIRQCIVYDLKDDDECMIDTELSRL
ncbi:hypothetical protein AA313_de0209946 [Arthrobotrys entomopaga]|nr:hypothetical protein AA313_de0209946 [Arthrobotrys entomopaga]